MEDLMIFEKHDNKWHAHSEYELEHLVNHSMIDKAADTPGTRYTDDLISYSAVNHNMVCVYYDVIGAYKKRELDLRKHLHELKNQINIVVSLAFFETRRQADNKSLRVINKTCQDTVKTLDKITYTLNSPIYHPERTIDVLVVTKDPDSLLITCLKDKPRLSLKCVQELEQEDAHYDVLFLDSSVDNTEIINADRIISLSEGDTNNSRSTITIPKHTKLDDIYHLILAPPNRHTHTNN